MDSFKNDLKESSHDFKEIVWPEIKDLFGEGELIMVENTTKTKMAKKLDMLAGIDSWHVQKDNGIRGLASRVQWVDKPYNTFTIRKERESGAKTEYKKRKHAIDNQKGWLYPEFTIQAYISKGDNKKLLSVGVDRTRNIFSYIANNNVKTRTAKDTKTNEKAKFYIIEWSNLSRVKTK